MTVAATTSDSVFMAILALNSYSVSPVGTEVGDAVIVKTATDPYAPAADFYAVAYLMPDDSIVIAYRGLDTSSSATRQIGYQTGASLASGSALSAEATAAIKFYQQVESLYPDATISVTGHSLGGGLAGLVGSLYHLSGMVFDAVNYVSAANAAYNGNYLGNDNFPALMQQAA